MKNEQNYGLVSTVYGGKINFLEFDESSYASTPKGLMVYNQVIKVSIGKVVINSYVLKVVKSILKTTSLMRK